MSLMPRPVRTDYVYRPAAAVKEAGIERSAWGEKYSIFSLRHLYSVNALRNGVRVFELTRNMGTSVEIIQVMGNRLRRLCLHKAGRFRNAR